MVLVLARIYSTALARRVTSLVVHPPSRPRAGSDRCRQCMSSKKTLMTYRVPPSYRVPHASICIFLPVGFHLPPANQIRHLPPPRSHLPSSSPIANELARALPPFLATRALWMAVGPGHLGEGRGQQGADQAELPTVHRSWAFPKRWGWHVPKSNT